MKKRYLILVTGLILVNFPPLNGILLGLIDSNSFKYSNRNGSLTHIQNFGFKSGGYIDKIWVEEKIIKEELKEIQENQEVFRLYRINPLCFWRWNYYIFCSSNFKYKSWEEIEPNRVPYNPDNISQRF